MSGKGKEGRVPQIRFAGFTDPWEQRKLGELFEESDQRSATEEILSVSVANGIYPAAESDRETNPGASIANYKVVRVGDIVYNSMRMWQGAVDSSKYNGIVSPAYVVARPYEKLDSACFGYLLKRPSMLYKYLCDSQGNSKDTQTLKYERFAEIEAEIPPTVEEQKAISDYMGNLDSLITLHQHKYDKLCEVKKSMLDKMFPKGGSLYPEIRFAGFTDPWEQRKLGGIYGSIGNAFVGTATPYYVEQGHFYLESNNVKDGQINHNSEIFINDEFYEKQKDKWLHTGDMVMVQSGHVGHAAVIPEELDNTAAHALIMFRNPKEEIEPYFLNYEYQTDKANKKIENITTGNTIKHILASDMQEFIVDVPKYEEQKVIAGYFRNLDHLITLHQRKLELLRNIKKAMLDKMFA